MPPTITTRAPGCDLGPLSARIASRFFEPAAKIEATTLSAFALRVMESGPPWCRAALEAGGRIDVWGAFLAANTLGVLATVTHPNGSAREVIWAPGDDGDEDRYVETAGLRCDFNPYVGDIDGPASVTNGTLTGRARWPMLTAARAATPSAMLPTRS